MQSKFHAKKGIAFGKITSTKKLVAIIDRINKYSLTIFEISKKTDTNNSSSHKF